VIWVVGHSIQCNNFSDLETPDDGRVRPKHVVRRKGGNNKLHCRRKYTVWNKWYINATGCLNTILWNILSQVHIFSHVSLLSKLYYKMKLKSNNNKTMSLLQPATCWLGLLSGPEDGGGMFLQIVGISPNYEALQPEYRNPPPPPRQAPILTL
jgi:hypothetical protein